MFHFREDLFEAIYKNIQQKKMFSKSGRPFLGFINRKVSGAEKKIDFETFSRGVFHRSKTFFYSSEKNLFQRLL